jgi:squalene-hopene/tetraprenyl-beta-curcumene cyclase
MKMTDVHPDAVRNAIVRAQDGVFSRQSPDGAWRTCDRAGPPSTGWGLVAIVFLGVKDRFELSGAVHYLLAQQLPSGAFPDYPGDTQGSMASTCACYAGLYAVGTDPTSDAMERAWQNLSAQGGFEAADPITQAFAAAAGLIAPTQMTSIPMGWMLIPGARYLISQHISPAFQLIFNALPGLLQGLRARRALPQPAKNPLQWMEDTSCIRYLKDHQDPTGHWQGTMFHTALCAMTLHTLGVPSGDAAIMRAVANFKNWIFPLGDGWQFAPYNSEAWNSALCVSALVGSGIAADEPRIRKAVVFLLSAQGRLDAPRQWQNPVRGAPRHGGWAFEAANSYNLDCDSTSQVLRALSLCRDLPSVQPAIDEGLAWLFGMQNREGGWPSFTHGLKGKPPGPYSLGTYMPKAPLQQIEVIIRNAGLLFGDPATADVSGRVLQALGMLGYRMSEPAAASAVAFLRAQVYDNGVWWGRWECNFLPASAYILLGLAAIGEDLSAVYIKRAVTFLVGHQNPDGGFGERLDSYGNLGFAGIGKSNPYTTGLIVSALLAVGGPKDTVMRAVDYLLATQRPSGLWFGIDTALTMNFPLPFYKLPTDVWTAPLQALADYLKGTIGVSEVRPQ